MFIDRPCGRGKPNQGPMMEDSPVGSNRYRIATEEWDTTIICLFCPKQGSGVCNRPSSIGTPSSGRPADGPAHLTRGGPVTMHTPPATRPPQVSPAVILPFLPHTTLHSTEQFPRNGFHPASVSIVFSPFFCGRTRQRGTMAPCSHSASDR